MYDVASNEKLDALLAQAPVCNVATYEVYPLAEMRGATRIGTAEPECSLRLGRSSRRGRRIDRRARPRSEQRSQISRCESAVHSGARG